MLLQLAQKKNIKKETGKKKTRISVFKLLIRPMKTYLCLSFPSEDGITLQAHAWLKMRTAPETPRLPVASSETNTGRKHLRVASNGRMPSWQQKANTNNTGLFISSHHHYKILTIFLPVLDYYRPPFQLPNNQEILSRTQYFYWKNPKYERGFTYLLGHRF